MANSVTENMNHMINFNTQIFDVTNNMDQNEDDLREDMRKKRNNTHIQPLTKEFKTHNTQKRKTLTETIEPSATRKRNNVNIFEPNPRPNKVFKTSYFNDSDRYYNDPDEKIVFLVTDKKYDVVPDDDDEFWNGVFNEEDINPLLDLLNNNIKNHDTKKITTKTVVNPSNKKPPNKDTNKRPRWDERPINPPSTNPLYNPFLTPPLVPPKPLLPNPGPKPNTSIIIIPPSMFGGNSDDDVPASPPKKQKMNNVTSEPLVIDCKNPLCNHKSIEEDPSPPTFLDYPEIKSIDDLIAMGKAFHCKKQTTYRGLNLRLMNNLVSPLTEMNNMIGLANVKKHMVDQILFFLQGFNSTEKCNKCQDCSYGLPCIQSNTEMLHTVILGPPGVGKTCLARIVGKVYKAMGILSNGEFHEVTRTDFVTGYLGQTAIKTQKLIDKCMGGVMFIDEAYSLGNKEKRDSFSKEALDTLNKNLSDKRDFLCIIAGYEKDLDECFFSFNDGLRRRFTFRYKAEAYDHDELSEIFKLKVKLENWTIDLNSENTSDDDPNKYSDVDLLALFRNNKDKFPYQGGDIETLFLQSKICHGRRLPLKKKCFSFKDIEHGFELFTKNRKHKKHQKDEDEEKRPNMYKL